MRQTYFLLDRSKHLHHQDSRWTSSGIVYELFVDCGQNPNELTFYNILMQIHFYRHFYKMSTYLSFNWYNYLSLRSFAVQYLFLTIFKTINCFPVVL